MKFLRNYLYEVLDSFFFTTSQVTKHPSHIRDGIDFKRMMMVVVYALVPTVIMALYNTGYQANLATIPSLFSFFDCS